MHSKVRIVGFVVLLALSVLVSAGVSSYQTRKHMAAGFVNVELFQLVFDKRVNDVLESKDAIGSPDVNDQMLSTLINIEIYQAPVSTMKGTPLRTLCELIVYAKRGGFAANSVIPKQYALPYLDSISKEVAEQMLNSYPRLRDTKRPNGQ